MDSRTAVLVSLLLNCAFAFVVLIVVSGLTVPLLLPILATSWAAGLLILTQIYIYRTWMRVDDDSTSEQN